jgi:hypothetical protein
VDCSDLKRASPLFAQSVSFEVLVDVWPTPEITGSYTGMTIEAEKEEYEEDLVAAALNVRIECCTCRCTLDMTGLHK